MSVDSDYNRGNKQAREKEIESGGPNKQNLNEKDLDQRDLNEKNLDEIDLNEKYLGVDKHKEGDSKEEGNLKERQKTLVDFETLSGKKSAHEGEVSEIKPPG